MSLFFLTNQKLPLERLSDEEIENPELVFRQFFEYTDLADSRKMLNETCKSLTKRKSVLKARRIKNDDTLYFFEKMEKVIEAAYLLR